MPTKTSNGEQKVSIIKWHQLINLRRNLSTVNLYLINLLPVAFKKMMATFIICRSALNVLRIVLMTTLLIYCRKYSTVNHKNNQQTV